MGGVAIGMLTVLSIEGIVDVIASMLLAFGDVDSILNLYNTCKTLRECRVSVAYVLNTIQYVVPIGRLLDKFWLPPLCDGAEEEGFLSFYRSICSNYVESFDKQRRFTYGGLAFFQSTMVASSFINLVILRMFAHYPLNYFYFLFIWISDAHRHGKNPPKTFKGRLLPGSLLLPWRPTVRIKLRSVP